MYFCAACKVYVKDANVTEHDQSTAHLLSSCKGISVRKVWLPETNRGYQMLKSMGWQEPRGLGSGGDGRITPIKTTAKNDRAGIGAHSNKKEARAAHVTPQNENLMAVNGCSDEKCVQYRLARKRKHPLIMTKAQKKLQKHREQLREKAIKHELYMEGFDSYEEFLR